MSSQPQPQEEFLLKWNEHHNSFFGMLQELCVSEFMTDVTLACGGQIFETHKLILCVCSPFFKNLLSKSGSVGSSSSQGRHPIIFLKSVSPKHLGQLLQYMYRGEINVLQEDLGPLVETAKELQIKGLADAPDKTIPPLMTNNHQHIGGKNNSNHGNASGALKTEPSSPPRQSSTPNNTPLNAFGQIPKEPPEVIRKEWADEDEEYGEVYPEPEFMTEDIGDPGHHQSQSQQQQQQHPLKSKEEAAAAAMEGGEDGGLPQLRRPSGGASVLLNKDLTCEVCFKQFSVPSKLSQHVIIHSGIKPYVCEICQMAFNVLGNLRRHIRTKHRSHGSGGVGDISGVNSK